MEILFILGAIVLVAAMVAAMVLLIGRALGDPQPQSRRFDETPADVVMLDTSDGTPTNIITLDDGTQLNSDEWDINIPRRMTPEEQEQATKQFERLRARVEAERRS